MDASDIADLFGYLRYGMPTSQKEAIAASGSLPGAPVDHSVDHSVDQDAANRYAAGYLFKKAHPIVAPIVQGAVDYIHGLSGPFHDSPDLQSYATAGQNQATLDSDNEDQKRQAAQVAGQRAGLATLIASGPAMGGM